MSPKTKSSEINSGKETEANQVICQDLANQSSSVVSTKDATKDTAKDTTKDATKDAIKDVTKDPNVDNQPRGLILEMRWSTKNLLINHLNQLSAVAYKKTITKQIEDLLLRHNDHLLLILANLPLQQIVDEVPCNEPLECASIEDPISNELYLDIGADFRIEIIQALITNKNYAVSYHSSVSNRAKIDLVKENNKIITRLLELPVKIKSHLVISGINDYVYSFLKGIFC